MSSAAQLILTLVAASTCMLSSEAQLPPEFQTVTTQTQYNNCTPCDIPLSEEAGAKVFGAFNCSSWYDDATYDDAGSEMCKLNRIAGVAFCGCGIPSQVTESCSLCPNGSIDIDLARELPDVPGVTCGDILSIPKIDGDESCDLLQSKYAFWCDCPSAKPSCTLCPTGSFPPKPEKALPFDANIYCGDIATEFLISTSQQCSELKSEIPVDLASFCECPKATAPETCALCPSGFAINDDVVVENDITCNNIHQMARFSLDTNICDVLADVQDKCCTPLFGEEGASAAPTSVQFLGSVIMVPAIASFITIFFA